MNTAAVKRSTRCIFVLKDENVAVRGTGGIIVDRHLGNETCYLSSTGATFFLGPDNSLLAA